MRGGTFAATIPVFALAFVLIASPGTLAADPPAAPDVPAPHDPILIDGDTGFDPSNGVVGGSGTAADPYRIENWTIAAPSGTGVQLVNTTAYVAIRNVTVSTASGAGIGISLENVSHARITSSEVYGFALGVSLASVHNSTVESSWVHNTMQTGLVAGPSYVGNTVVYDNDNLTIAGNVFTSNGYVVLRVVGTSVRISGNDIADAQDGLLASLGDSVVENNTFRNQTTEGMYLDGAHRVTLRGNLFTSFRTWNAKHIVFEDNRAPSVRMQDSTDVTIRGNVFPDYQWGASPLVYAVRTADVAIHHNEFLNPYGTVDLVSSLNFTWDNGYPSGGNYWASYTGPDVCSGVSQSVCGAPDGIGDVPRPVNATMIDHYPLMWRPSVPNTPPIPSFTVNPATAKPGDPIRVDASGSTDAEEPTSGLRVRWDWQDDGVWDTTLSPAKSTTVWFAVSGLHSIRLQVYDRGGLQATLVHQVTVDGAPPVTSVALRGTAGDHGWFRSPVTMTLQATDNLSGIASVEYREPGSAWSVYDAPIVIQEGVHALAYRSTDRVGNVEDARNVTVSIDASPPTIRDLAVGVPEAGRISVTWDANDSGSGVDHYELSVDGGAFESVGSASRRTLLLGSGGHGITVRAVDAAGNVVERTVSVFMDPWNSAWIPLIATSAVAAAVVGIAVLLVHRRRRGEP